MKKKTSTFIKKRKTLVIVLGTLLVLLIALRIALPYILLKWVNKELQPDSRIYRARR